MQKKRKDETAMQKDEISARIAEKRHAKRRRFKFIFCRGAFSSFGVTSFLLLAWCYFVFSPSLVRLFVFLPGVFSPRKDEKTKKTPGEKTPCEKIKGRHKQRRKEEMTPREKTKNKTKQKITSKKKKKKKKRHAKRRKM